MDFTTNYFDHERAVTAAARRIGATPADIPGLWNAPGYPELTTAQLLSSTSRPPSPLGSMITQALSTP